MKFKLVEELDKKDMYDGWLQEDIELYESINWEEVDSDEYDAGCAYLGSALLLGDKASSVNTEFHKFFKKSPYEKPYYKPIDKKVFYDVNINVDNMQPTSKGDLHNDYDVLNLYGGRLQEMV